MGNSASLARSFVDCQKLVLTNWSGPTHKGGVTTKTTTLRLVLVIQTTETIETTGETVPPSVPAPRPGLAKCLPVRALRAAGGSR